MSDKSAIATERFLKGYKGYNCAQSVFYAFREEVGLNEDTVLKMTCGLGAGMGAKRKSVALSQAVSWFWECCTAGKQRRSKINRVDISENAGAYGTLRREARQLYLPAVA